MAGSQEHGVDLHHCVIYKDMWPWTSGELLVSSETQFCPLERYIEVYGLCLGEATGAQSLSPIVAQPRQGWHSRAPCKILDCQDSDGGSLLLSKCE